MSENRNTRFADDVPRPQGHPKAEALTAARRAVAKAVFGEVAVVSGENVTAASGENASVFGKKSGAAQAAPRSSEVSRWQTLVAMVSMVALTVVSLVCASSWWQVTAN